MSDFEKADMKQFETLEEFKKGSNNYWVTFVEGEGVFAYIYRGKKSFERFQEKYPEIEEKLTDEVTKLMKEDHPSFYYPENFEDNIYEKMFEAYKLMSQLVSVDDKDVIRDGEVDERYLLR